MLKNQKFLCDLLYLYILLILFLIYLLMKKLAEVNYIIILNIRIFSMSNASMVFDIFLSHTNFFTSQNFFPGRVVSLALYV